MLVNVSQYLSMLVNVSHLAHALLVLLDNLDVLVHTLRGNLGTLALVAEINQSEISIQGT